MLLVFGIKYLHFDSFFFNSEQTRSIEQSEEGEQRIAGQGRVSRFEQGRAGASVALIC